MTKPDLAKARPRYHNVDGAPISIGQLVKVNPDEGDCTSDPDCDGMTGCVVYLEYDCGCGQTFPTDPMIGVKMTFDDKIREFWFEELILVPSTGEKDQ